MNKEVYIVVGLSVLGFAIVLAVRDNLPKGNFSFKKQS